MMSWARHCKSFPGLSLPFEISASPTSAYSYTELMYPSLCDAFFPHNKRKAINEKGKLRGKSLAKYSNI